MSPKKAARPRRRRSGGSPRRDRTIRPTICRLAPHISFSSDVLLRRRAARHAPEIRREVNQMLKLFDFLDSLSKREEGQTMAEYGVVLAVSYDRRLRRARAPLGEHLKRYHQSRRLYHLAETAWQMAGPSRTRGPPAQFATTTTSIDAKQNLTQKPKRPVDDGVRSRPADPLPAPLQRDPVRVVFNNYITVTDAVRAGARKGAVSRRLNDPAGAAVQGVRRRLRKSEAGRPERDRNGEPRLDDGRRADGHRELPLPDQPSRPRREIGSAFQHDEGADRVIRYSGYPNKPFAPIRSKELIRLTYRVRNIGIAAGARAARGPVDDLLRENYKQNVQQSERVRGRYVASHDIPSAPRGRRSRRTG